jgi:hypothetical protein
MITMTRVTEIVLYVAGFVIVGAVAFSSGAYSIYNNIDRYTTPQYITKTVEVVKTVEVPTYITKTVNVPSIIKEVVYTSVLRKASYAEVMALVNGSKVQGMIRVNEENDKFICLDYSMTVRGFAHELGYKCAIVSFDQDADLAGGEDMYGHAINVFDSSDRGFIYIEPQYGWEVPEPRVGTNYWVGLNKVALSKGYTQFKLRVSYVACVRYIW